jgi:calcineurin-like phosphoesterase family protein
MSKVYFISDCHFGHRNIGKYRTQFSSHEEHDEFVFENIMSTVNKRDTLWMLGDMFFDGEVLEKYGKHIAERAGYTHLILGNHDTDNIYRKKNVGRMFDLFDSVHGLHSKYGYWISHAPIHPVELRGKVNIHGHVHFATVMDPFNLDGEGRIPDPNYVNVCCENVNYKPIALQDIKAGWRSYD